MARILKLDRMEILGFKSFYGRTRFDFPDGITAVVGPNGCGKSNIGDAISWVLGEQKASSLRSDRMEDVIFNGSEGRRPLGMAEVSLHFKNLLSAGGNGNGSHGNGGAAAIAEHDAPPLAPVDHEVPIAQAAECAPSPAPSAAPVEGESPALRFTGIEEIPPEVVVTRRIYRSGESEYILNGERCRLKDIQDLLARTDIGSRLYSTIEQGKIDQVLAARPKDRRAMFEEAAGILGYRGKRHQAELKLEAAQANLLRINDIVVEVEKQIGALRRQAAKARRYRRLVDDLRDKRLALMRHRVALADAERHESRITIEGLRSEDIAAAAGLASDEADLERLRLQLEEGEAGARSRREEIHALDLEIDRVQERLRAGQDQARDLESRLSDGDREILALRTRLSEHEERLQATLGKIAEIEDTLTSAASSTMAVALDDGERAAAIEARETALEEARAALLQRLERIAALTRGRTALEEQTRLARVALEKIGRDSEESAAARERLASESATLAREAEAGQERARAGDLERAAAVETERAAAGLVAAAEKRAEELKGRAAVLSERLAALLEMEQQHAGFSEGVGDILNGSAGVATRGVVGDRLLVPRGLEKAVQATLGDLLEAVVVQGTDDALRGVGYLRGNARGRVSFVAEGPAGSTAPAGPPPPGPGGSASDPAGSRLSDRIGGVPAGSIGAILERTLLVDDLEAALRLRAERPEFLYVTPQGDIVRHDGSITGGDGRALQHWLLQRRAERDETGQRLSEIEAARRESEETCPRLRDHLAGAQERLRDAAQTAEDQTRRAFEVGLRSQQAAAELERIERTLPLLANERARLERDIDLREAEMTALEREGRAHEDDRRALEETIQAMSGELPGMRAELERVRRESAEAKAARAAAEERRQSLGRERDGLREGIADLEGLLGRRSREHDEGTARLAQLREQEGSLAQQRGTAQESRAAAASRDESAHAGLAYERGLVHSREQAVREGRTAQASLRGRLQEQELRLARTEADLEHLERACREELATTVEELRGLPAPAPGDPGLEEREAEVQRVRSEIDAIGPVNLMAVEQQTDLEERFSFLSAQKRDLEEAIASLRDTIRRINREARERFQSAFAAIQEHFLECFKTLFGGGTAELRLSEGEDDVLEAGIEIVAQPPGKRLQKIGLLSGGEKALTAVSLLVSLFRHRPSPFCILDEVDAPLDEANVGRFTLLLQQLRSDTQFILITHNRKSMEAADLLYGVTMEEPGVSKILPLRFE